MTTKQKQAKIVRKALHNTPPEKRTQLYKGVRDKADLNELDERDLEVAKAYMDGISDEGIKEILIAVGMWLAENDITEFTPRF